MTKKITKSPASQLDFDGQRDGEKLLFVFRRHIIAMRKGFYLLLGTFTIASLPMLIFGMTVDYDTMISLLGIAVAGFGVGLVFFAYHFILWYFTIYIVTDQRIRQVTQRGFFGKDVVELRL